jgi:hypothetical protein
MPVTIAWIDGCWGDPDDLQLPLSDRGLQLADGLFETVLVRNGQPQLLQEHLQRWSDSAALLGMDVPPQRSTLQPLIPCCHPTLRSRSKRRCPSPQLEPWQLTPARNRASGLRTPPLLVHTSALYADVFTRQHHH